LALSRALAKAFCSAVFLRRTQAALASGAPAQVGARFAGPVSLQELADAASQLTRTFIRHAGTTPGRFRNRHAS
jgi:hypothetical protein